MTEADAIQRYGADARKLEVTREVRIVPHPADTQQEPRAIGSPQD